MIRMSETTRTHTTGQQLDWDILISSLMKHVLTNVPLRFREIAQRNLGHKIFLSWPNVTNWEGKKVRFGVWCSFVLSSILVFVLLEPFQNSGNLFKRRMFHLNFSWGGLLDFRVQNLLTLFNDGSNCRPVSLISLTETMCLIEKTGDSTHWWGWGGCNTPLPPKFRVTNFLGNKRDLGKANFYKSFHVSFSPFLCFERSICFLF